VLSEANTNGRESKDTGTETSNGSHHVVSVFARQSCHRYIGRTVNVIERLTSLKSIRRRLKMTKTTGRNSGGVLGSLNTNRRTKASRKKEEKTEELPTATLLISKAVELDDDVSILQSPQRSPRINYDSTSDDSTESEESSDVSEEEDEEIEGESDFEASPNRSSKSYDSADDELIADSSVEGDNSSEIDDEEEIDADDEVASAESDYSLSDQEDEDLHVDDDDSAVEKKRSNNRLSTDKQVVISQLDSLERPGDTDIAAISDSLRQMQVGAEKESVLHNDDSEVKIQSSILDEALEDDVQSEIQSEKIVVVASVVDENPDDNAVSVPPDSVGVEPYEDVLKDDERSCFSETSVSQKETNVLENLVDHAALDQGCQQTQTQAENTYSSSKERELKLDDELETSISSVPVSALSSPVVREISGLTMTPQLQQAPKSYMDISSPRVERSVNRLLNTEEQRRHRGMVQRGKWKLGSKLGTGAFGVVHIGMNTSTGALMAVKSIMMDSAVKVDVRREIELLKMLKHCNIVSYIGAEMDKEFLHIFQEWVSGGSVSSMISKFGTFSLDVIRSYMRQILHGLEYLHENNVIHRDLKGSNVLVTHDGIVKLADFGASRRFDCLTSDMMMNQTLRGSKLIQCDIVHFLTVYQRPTSWLQKSLRKSTVSRLMFGVLAVLHTKCCLVHHLGSLWVFPTLSLFLAICS